MGSRDEVQTALADALNDADSLGDASRGLTLRGQFDEVETPGRGVRTEFELLETDGEAVKVAKATFIVLQNELAAQPEIDDLLIDSDDGRIYVIESAESDGAKAAWEIKGTT